MALSLGLNVLYFFGAWISGHCTWKTYGVVRLSLVISPRPDFCGGHTCLLLFPLSELRLAHQHLQSSTRPKTTRNRCLCRSRSIAHINHKKSKDEVFYQQFLDNPSIQRWASSFISSQNQQQSIRQIFNDRVEVERHGLETTSNPFCEAFSKRFRLQFLLVCVGWMVFAFSGVLLSLLNVSFFSSRFDFGSKQDMFLYHGRFFFGGWYMGQKGGRVWGNF